MDRRNFLRCLATAAASGIVPQAAIAAGDDLYDIGRSGNVRILHQTDTHAQLEPVYFREPSVNIGVGTMRGQPPHLVGKAFLEHFGIAPGSRGAYALTYLDYQDAARRYGRMGGFAYLKTLIDRLRAEAGAGNALLLDGGDLWQGTGQANALHGADMIAAANLLGVEAMTGHWEFTYGDETLVENLKAFKGTFLAQNVLLTEEAAFADKTAYDTSTGRVFKPSLIKEVGGKRIAVIGQAFPYVPIAHPKRFTPDWTFGIREQELQKLVDDLRGAERADAIILLSHNGMDVDLKLASRVSGIDVILGGHTHDAVPQPMTVTNNGGKTLVTNAGSNGKFLGVIDLDVERGVVKDMRYTLLPVFADLIKPDAAMLDLIKTYKTRAGQRAPEKLATCDHLLYRRGNFTGPMDQVICDALRQRLNAQIALSPGFRWGTTVPAKEGITTEHVGAATAITYPEVYVQDMTGEQIKAILEDVADNLFNPDPYYQQGGDMVRVGGMDYACAPNQATGSRISDMTLNDGTTVEAGKSYRVAGWASVNPQTGEPVAGMLEAYLRDNKNLSIKRPNRVILKGIEDNPGYAEGG
ncbi:MAG TPA: thiosulfohydrolase SoxB [Xanthobacteraceae bacterium]|jgi:sulfur-oxidizing protein SoxB|nr:thiosulfohydrolase SoxB [Xanthobacteraceae bacterium]